MNRNLYIGILTLLFPLAVIAQEKGSLGPTPSEVAAAERMALEQKIEKEKWEPLHGLPLTMVVQGKTLQVKYHFDLSEDEFYEMRGNQLTVGKIESELNLLVTLLSDAEINKNVSKKLAALVIEITKDETGYETYIDSRSGAISLHRRVAKNRVGLNDAEFALQEIGDRLKAQEDASRWFSRSYEKTPLMDKR